MGEDKRITITAVEEGTGSVTIHASTPGYQDAELTLQVHSVPELISMTILGDRLERNNVVHLAEGGDRGTDSPQPLGRRPVS